MASGPDLSIEIANKRFAGAELPLFAEFQLHVAAGSVVAIVGPSGVGKSTLLRLIAGIDPGFEGQILRDGAPVTTSPPAGFVFQDARLLPWLTSIENLRAVAPGLTRDAALTLLASVGLRDSADAYPEALSGGMQRRVALARALAVNPGFLLLDEPFVSLDRGLVREVRALFSQRIAEIGATALLVTHMAEDAALFADRVVVLGGRPVEIVADIALPGPRGERDAESAAALTHQIETVIGRA